MALHIMLCGVLLAAVWADVAALVVIVFVLAVGVGGALSGFGGG
jgi:hypothetical protein